MRLTIQESSVHKPIAFFYLGTLLHEDREQVIVAEPDG